MGKDQFEKGGLRGILRRCFAILGTLNLIFDLAKQLRNLIFHGLAKSRHSGPDLHRDKFQPESRELTFERDWIPRPVKLIAGREMTGKRNSWTFYDCIIFEICSLS